MHLRLVLISKSVFQSQREILNKTKYSKT